MTATVWTWPDSTAVRIIDGDSLIARVSRDLGFHGTATFEQRLRLNRINTPPASTDQGKAATIAAATFLLGKPLMIETVGPYKYGDEWMAEVTLPDGTNVSDALVAGAWAVYWDGKGPRPGG